MIDESPPPARASVLAQITALTRLDRKGLCDEWRHRFGEEPPGYGHDLLRRRLAYRIQEQAYGGLPPETRERLREISKRCVARKDADPNRPNVGTLIIKEYRGERHEVVVLAEGYQYRGRRFESLSAVARVISGTNWNGWRFFGLRPQCPRSEG